MVNKEGGGPHLLCGWGPPSISHASLAGTPKVGLNKLIITKTALLFSFQHYLTKKERAHGRHIHHDAPWGGGFVKRYAPFCYSGFSYKNELVLTLDVVHNTPFKIDS